jgi:membrane protein
MLLGLTELVRHLAGVATPDFSLIFHAFLPPHELGPRDPFAIVEALLTGIASNPGAISLYAVPTFIWFSTRLFAGVRTSLNHVFDVSLRPRRRRNFLAVWAVGKARDAAMVLMTLFLFIINFSLTAALALFPALSRRYPQFELVVGNLGRFLGEALTVLFSIVLFFLIYKYASVRRLPWRTALLAGTFAAVAFEIAKRLYGLYLTNFAGLRAASGDATIGALILFVLWVYYTALVFLLGGVVAETWELRRMQQRQRAILR